MTDERLALRNALERGMDIARDPANAHCTHPDDTRITTIFSPWLLYTCRVCHHTIRQGDLVRPDPRVPAPNPFSPRMLHEDPANGLCCWSRDRGLLIPDKPTITACPHEVRDAFLRGLQQHWQPADVEKTVLVQPDDAEAWAYVGRKCPICNHTVRPGDRVVPCPCGNGCGGVFHQDVIRHLTCWDTWNRGTRRTHCVFTEAPYQQPPDTPGAPAHDD